MHMRRLLLATATVILAGTAVAVTGVSAYAAKPAGQGTLTCTISGNVTFTPPLTATGTTGFKHDTLQFNLSASNCSGPSSNTPQPNPTSATFKTHPFHAGDTGTGSNKVAGACYNTGSSAPFILKSTLTWAGGPTIRNTSINVDVMGANNGPPALIGTGTTGQHSYFGSASLLMQLTTDTATNVEQVCGLGMPGSVPEMDFDPTVSTMTVGQTGTT
jgi:hypothetical protein